MYAHGQGLKQAYGEAARLFRKAADQGHAYAQCNLGVMFDQDHGMKQDHGKAARLFRKAADQTTADAQCHLGVMYDLGQGVKQDYGEAARWFCKATDQGHEVAERALLIVEEQLRKRGQAAVPNQPSSSRTCANCGFAEAASGGPLKP